MPKARIPSFSRVDGIGHDHCTAGFRTFRSRRASEMPGGELIRPAWASP